MKTIKITTLCFILSYFTIISIHAQIPHKDFFKSAKTGQIELVSDYLNNGVDINSKDKNGKTILMYASEKGHEEVVISLLEKGANIYLTDNNGSSAMSLANKKQQYKILDILSFEVAQNENTQISYEKYIKNYPNGQYIEQAKIELENCNYKAAVEVNSLEFYDVFLEKYPTSKYCDDLTLRKDTLFYRQVLTDQSIDSYLNYLNLYPSGSYSSIIKSKRDSLLQLCIISDEEARTIISELETLAFPFTLNEIYVESSSENDKLDTPNDQHFKFITKSDMNLMGDIIKYRTSKRVVDKEISTKVTIYEGHYAYVEILKGKETLMDLYNGEYEGKELIMVFRCEKPVPNSAFNSFGFESVKIYKEEATLKYLIINDKWYKI